jgi:hypothetical protein
VLALLLITAALALSIPTGVAAASKGIAAIVLAAAAARFVLVGAYEATGSPGLRDAGGGVGMAVAVLALYAALALELESALRKPVLPVLRTGRGAAAMSGDLTEQVATVAHEAGVRQQL